MDSVMSRMIGIKPETIRALQYASEIGLGPIDESEIEVEGDAARLKRFRRPVPSIPQRFTGTWIMAFFPDIGRQRFEVDEYVCNSCRSCADACRGERSRSKGRTARSTTTRGASRATAAWSCARRPRSAFTRL